MCYAGWMGEACDLKACPRDCHNRGYCVNGTCDCVSPWAGADCSAQPCPDNCSNRGVCKNDKCYCPVGYTGDACQTRVLSAKWARTSRYGANAALMPEGAPGELRERSGRPFAAFLEMARAPPEKPPTTPHEVEV